MDKKSISKEIYVGIFLVVLCLVIALYLIPNQIAVKSSFGNSGGINTRSFPYLATAIIGVSALVHIISYAIKYAKLDKTEKVENNGEVVDKNLKGEIQAVIIFALFLVYGILFDKFGFILSSILIPPSVLFVLGSRNKFHYISIFIFNILIFLIFQFLLNIPLIR